MYQPDTKHFSVSGYHKCLFQPICPRHPGCYRMYFISCREVIKRLTADQLHGPVPL